MIDGLSLRNFKCFGSVDVPFGPLTVVTGLNGAGKSSLLQGLLLGREAAMSADRDVVSLNGPYGLALGDALDVLNRRAVEQVIAITVTEAGTAYPYRFAIPDERKLHLDVTSRSPRRPVALTGSGAAFTYLAAERLGPRDQLAVASEEMGKVGVGVRGEYTAHALATRETRLVSDSLLHPRTADHGVRTLRTQVEEWTADIVRRLRITATWPAGMNASLLRFAEPDAIGAEEVRPTNMGFGVSYALPVIVAGLLAEPGAVLMVENPEAHLHPRGQSQMGRFLGRVSGAGVQVIVETHSDHVINGVRMATAVDRSVRPEDVLILFAGDDADYQFHRITVSGRGSLSDWPPGFFDQLESDLGGLSRVRRGT